MTRRPALLLRLKDRIHGALLLVFFVLFSHGLGAEEVNWPQTLLAPNLDHFCVDSRGTRAVDSKRLLLWLLDFVAISDAAMDLDGDGNTLYTEKVALIANPEVLPSCVEKGRCSELDQEKVLRIQAVISSLWNAEPNNPFSTGYLPGREGSESRLDLAAFFDPAKGLVTQCPSDDDVAKLASPESPVPQAVWYDNFLLREKPEDITKPVNEASPAKFSLERNKLSDTSDVEIDLLLAYRFYQSQGPRHTSDYYLFGQLETDIQQVNEVESDSSSNPVSLGLLASYGLGRFDNRYLANHKVTFRPTITRDTIKDNESVTLTATWSPIPELGERNFFLHSVPVGSYALFKLNWDFRTESGRVINEGQDPIFNGIKRFVDLGYNTNFLISGAKNTFLERMQWDTNYKKLYSMEADQENKEYISSKLRYFVSGNFNIGLEYEKGRKGVQFNAVDKWKINFGTKL